MPKLFELYAFAKMKNAGLHVSYQQNGNYGTVDFLVYDKDEPVIIDTKYKKLYDNEEYDINDIRQVSAYARDIRLLENLYGLEYESKKNSVPACLIIYPELDENNSKDIPSEPGELLTTKIEQFNKFYRYGISIKRP
jgi:5-methylcytosine-specific restriction endonuclease McrBC regulatory subunit McrC